MYTEDGQTYDAVIVAVDGGSGNCTIRYDYYNNEEVQRLDDLLPVSDVHPPHHQTYTNSLRSDVSSHVDHVV